MKQSRFGPGFADARAKLYRAEYALVTISIVTYLVWRSMNVGVLDWLQVVFLVAFPDLASFIPIGGSSK